MKLSNEQQDVLQLLAWLHLQCARPERARVLLEVLLRAVPQHRVGRAPNGSAWRCAKQASCGRPCGYA